jgi:hypothetical protein
VRGAADVAQATARRSPAHAPSATAFRWRAAVWLGDGDEVVPGLQIVVMHGSKTPGELALVLREGRERQDPVRCADARVVVSNPLAQDRAEMRLDSGIIQSRHSRRIVPMTRSQIAFALGLEKGERSTARPNARIESSRCRAKMRSRSWIRYL